MTSIFTSTLIGPLVLAAVAAVEPVPIEPVDLSLMSGRGTIVECPNGVARVATSNPDVVDAVTASGREVLFQAKGIGQATLFVWSRTGERTTYNVTVEANLDPLRKLLREAFPNEDIDVRVSRDSVVLVGRASSPAVAERALALVGASYKGAVSNLMVPPPPIEKQVVLHVKFAELSRSALSEFGVTLLSTGALNTPGRITTGQFASGNMTDLTGQTPGHAGGTSTTFGLSDMLNIFAFRPDLNLGAVIRDLQTRGLLQILAEPNLVAANGREASFLAGGEFPIPIVQGGNNSGSISIQFREYGIRLSFLPLLTPNRTVRLHVKPEVSSIDSANGVRLSGYVIPALSTRRIETDIELGEGQSFVIGGLLDDRVVESLSQVPGLAHVPVLGALFKSRSVSKTKTELIVVVTPEAAMPIVGPAPKLPAPIPFLGPPEEGKGQKP
jgi:pilus assembly protein CpaC